MKLFIFGSTGDLVRRKVLPALHSINRKDLEIWALGRKDFTREVYHDFACKGCLDEFKKNLHYKQVDFEHEELCTGCFDMFDKVKTNFVYISLPPQMIVHTLKLLAGVKKKGLGFTILIEKPFGNSLGEAEELEKIIDKEFSGEVFLSDHYLFKEGVAGLKKQDFKHLEIVAVESIGLEGRGSYYDEVGALKDMVQSHFLNIAFKLMKKPDEMENAEIVKFKRGQYEGYEKELGKKSKTETFVELKLKLGNKSFEFVTGKGFDRKISFMEIDGKKINLDTGENPYESIFKCFLAGKDDGYPTIEGSITAWKIIEKLEKNKPSLDYYVKGKGYK